MAVAVEHGIAFDGGVFEAQFGVEAADVPLSEACGGEPDGLAVAASLSVCGDACAVVEVAPFHDEGVEVGAVVKQGV